MAASIYRPNTSPSRFQQFAAGPTHYTTTAAPMHLRYNAFAIEGHAAPLPSTPPMRAASGNGMLPLSSMNLATPPPGATLGLLGGAGVHKPMYPMPPQQPPPPQQQYPLPPGASAVGEVWRTASPLFVNPMLAKGYQQLMERQMGMMQPSEMLMVSPGMPTPLELSIYEVKQPTGFLHVTAGNQTVEFLDGVANMPRKR
ncbi:hypothetical protein PybrP1_007937 [[Pythium] brassicae (nom. inval.)]|nr:hypothetical protein PybrP1_007937 [[Pythium] brassicae (nom. inval.)]